MITDLAEKCPHDHIELLQYCLLFPADEDSLNDDDHEEYLQGQKRQVANHVNEDVVDVSKDEEMDEIWFFAIWCG